MICALLLVSLSEQDEPIHLGSLTGTEALACSSMVSEGQSRKPGSIENTRTRACAAAVEHLRKIDPETYQKMNWDTFTLEFKQRLNRMEIDFIPGATEPVNMAEYRVTTHRITLSMPFGGR